MITAVLFGGRMAEKRKLAGLSQEDLAEKVGRGQESLSRMEKGKTPYEVMREKLTV